MNIQPDFPPPTLWPGLPDSLTSSQCAPTMLGGSEDGVLYLEEGVVTASCELAGKLDVSVEPVLDGDTEAGENRCLRLRRPHQNSSRRGTVGVPTQWTLTPRNPPQC